jgi:uncharacterized LabA/DUF88 family protein
VRWAFLLLRPVKMEEQKRVSCKTTWYTHEETESDVNLATHLLHQAYLNSFDKAFIITADSDLEPAVQLVPDTFSTKEIIILTPPNRFNIARNLRGKF